MAWTEITFWGLRVAIEALAASAFLSLVCKPVARFVLAHRQSVMGRIDAARSAGLRRQFVMLQRIKATPEVGVANMLMALLFIAGAGGYMGLIFSIATIKAIQDRPYQEDVYGAIAPIVLIGVALVYFGQSYQDLVFNDREIAKARAKAQRKGWELIVDDTADATRDVAMS